MTLLKMLNGLIKPDAGAGGAADCARGWVQLDFDRSGTEGWPGGCSAGGKAKRAGLQDDWMLNIMEDKPHPNSEDRNSIRELHNSLSRICKNLPTDFQPWGERDRDAEWGPDCSCGCKFFLKLHGQLGNDWGVCWNPESPRSGLLTFEHQGCRHFVEEEELWDEEA